MKPEIESRFAENLNRVKHLVELYQDTASGPGRRPVETTDVLRAAVVFCRRLHMATREQLQRVLGSMPDIEAATVVGDRNLIATVVSGSFRNQDEAQRQEAVWAYIRRQLGSEDELQNIEFIFTNTPEENAA